MLYKKWYLITLIFVMFINRCEAWRTPKKQEVIISEMISESEAAYKKVYDHYSDILQVYYSLEKAELEKKDFYTKRLLYTIVRHVEQDILPLYGNCFSRAWRHISSSATTHFPLKKFTSMLVEDALGHLNKQYTKVAHKGYETTKIADLIRSLTYIRHIVTHSLEYKYEELQFCKEQLESEVVALKRQIGHLHNECQTLKATLDKRKDN